MNPTTTTPSVAKARITKAGNILRGPRSREGSVDRMLDLTGFQPPNL